MTGRIRQQSPGLEHVLLALGEFAYKLKALAGGQIVQPHGSGVHARVDIPQGQPVALADGVVARAAGFDIYISNDLVDQAVAMTGFALEKRDLKKHCF